MRAPGSICNREWDVYRGNGFWQKEKNLSSGYYLNRWSLVVSNSDCLIFNFCESMQFLFSKPVWVEFPIERPWKINHRGVPDHQHQSACLLEMKNPRLLLRRSLASLLIQSLWKWGLEPANLPGHSLHAKLSKLRLQGYIRLVSQNSNITSKWNKNCI